MNSDPLSEESQQQHRVEYKIEPEDYLAFIRAIAPKRTLWLRLGAGFFVLAIFFSMSAILGVFYYIALTVAFGIVPKLRAMTEDQALAVFLLLLIGVYALIISLAKRDNQKKSRELYITRLKHAASFDEAGFTIYRSNSRYFVAWEDSKLIDTGALLILLNLPGSGFFIPIGERGLSYAQVDTIKSLAKRQATW